MGFQEDEQKMRRIIVFLLPILLLIALCSCELSYQAPAAGKMHILVYGNDYSYGSKVYYESGELVEKAQAGKLYKTVNDALQVGRVLSNLAEKANLEYETHYITESGDTFKNVLVSELEAIASASSAADMTIIYYSGHGFGVKDKLDYGSDTASCSYLVPRDPAHPDSSVLFPVSKFLELVDSIRGVKVVLGDFCYSGSLVQSGFFSVTMGEYNLFDSSTLLLGDKIRESSSLFCLSAARYNELSYEFTSPSDPLHGKFTNALLKALGWDEENQTLTTAAAEKNGKITLFEVSKYVTAHDGESRQTPMVNGGSNDIVLFSF